MCNKAAYESRTEARAEARHGRVRKQLWAYLCPECGFWHLSSMDRKTAKRVEKLKKRGKLQ